MVDLTEQDLLTGLLHAGAFARRVDLALVQGIERAEPFALVVAELPPAADDGVLIEAARRLRDVTRSRDLVARSATAELAVCCPGATEAEGRAVARRVAELACARGRWRHRAGLAGVGRGFTRPAGGAARRGTDRACGIARGGQLRAAESVPRRDAAAVAARANAELQRGRALAGGGVAVCGARMPAAAPRRSRTGAAAIPIIGVCALAAHALAAQLAQAGRMRGPRSPFHDSAMSYYQRHVFFCLNQRADGRPCCGDHHAADMQAHAKARLKALDCNGRGKVRINKAGCLDRCDDGPCVVVYPEGVWYTYVDEKDIDEIVDSHLAGGKVVERLRI
jgi:(2Fe-2S) ferredoxin